MEDSLEDIGNKILNNLKTTKRGSKKKRIAVLEELISHLLIANGYVASTVKNLVDATNAQGQINRILQGEIEEITKQICGEGVPNDSEGLALDK